MTIDLIKETLNAISHIERIEIRKLSLLLINKYQQGGKILICGNGGSSTDAPHFVGELIGSFNNREAKGLPAIFLTTGEATGSAIANDYGYDNVFSRQIETYANPNDILICLSCSGDSKNIINAIKKAEEINLNIIFLTSKRCNTKSTNKKLNIIKIESAYTPAIQQAHMCILHLFCEYIEEIR